MPEVVSDLSYRESKRSQVFTGYGMVDLAAHARSTSFRVRPHVGMIFNLDTARVWAYFGAESTSYDGGFRDIWGGQIEYRLSERYSLRVEISNEQATRTSAGLNWYW